MLVKAEPIDDQTPINDQPPINDRPINDDIISIVSSVEESEDEKSHNKKPGWTAEHTAHYLWTRHTKSIRDRVARDVAHFRTIERKQYA